MDYAEILKKVGWKILSILMQEDLPRKPKQLWLDLELRVIGDITSEQYAKEFLSILIRRGGVFLPKWWEREEKPHKQEKPDRANYHLSWCLLASCAIRRGQTDADAVNG